MRDRLFARLRGLLTRRRARREADEELTFHVEQETAANIARGFSPDEARRLALRDLGGVTQTREAIHDVRTLGIEAVWRDARHAVRCEFNVVVVRGRSRRRRGGAARPAQRSVDVMKTPGQNGFSQAHTQPPRPAWAGSPRPGRGRPDGPAPTPYAGHL